MNFAAAAQRLAAVVTEAHGIRDARVREALAAIPRHAFVDEAFAARAYSDDALPIGYGQTISKPSTVACMTEALELQPGHRVLEVGTGSGYQAAVLARLVQQVCSVERIPSLALRARRVLHGLGVFNVEVLVGDGSLGWPERGPFAAILVTAAAGEVPAGLLAQLSVGGRLVCPVGSGEAQRLRRYLRVASDAWTEEDLQTCRFVPLVAGGAA